MKSIHFLEVNEWTLTERERKEGKLQRSKKKNIQVEI